MSKRLKLRDHHPTVIKLDKLMAYADTLGLTISFMGINTVVTDNEQLNKQFLLEDLEDTGRNNSSIQEFPYSLEWKLILEE